ncbi:MAG: UvrD-helicase domain-containing protein, partial [bacterium]
MSNNPALTMPLSGIQALDASAGTGKTYSIALIHLRLVLSGIPVEKILVTTFTDAAAAELRDRLRQRLAEARDVLSGVRTGDDNLNCILQATQLRVPAAQLSARLESALSCFDLAPICTIHGFCSRLLQDHALELGATPDCEIMADDPRLRVLAGDFLASQTLLQVETDKTCKAPDIRYLLTIARKLREYDLAVLPETLDNLREQTNAQWLATATAYLQQALTAWDTEHASIANGIRELVTTGKIEPGIFDNPNVDDGPKKWKKLDTSIFDMPALLLTAVQPGKMDFAAGIKRLFPDQLQKVACDQSQQEVNAFIARHVFFSHLEKVQSLLDDLVGARAAVQIRMAGQGFIMRASKLGPGRVLLYSDLINAVFNNLHNKQLPTAVRAMFEAVLIDECQDTDARQFEIFRTLFADLVWIGTPDPMRCLVWVGDPKQSIYRFRGADIDTYVRAKNGTKSLSLDVNFRSDKPLVAAINALFQGPGTGQSVFGAGVPFKPSSASHEVRVQNREPGDVPAFCLHTWKTKAGDKPPAKSAVMGAALRDCARSIYELIQSGATIQGDAPHRLHAGDIAVLAPERKQLEMMRRELRRLGIPSAYHTDSSVYLTDEARDLSLLLQALASARLPAVRAALTTPFFGYSLNTVIQMPESELSLNQACLLDLGERMEAEGFLSVLFALLRYSTQVEGAPTEPALVRLARLPEGERILTNVIQLGELLQAAWRDGHARSAEALKDWLDQAIARAEEGQESASVEESKLRLETDSPAVVLATIHTSKGLQYPIVFLPSMFAQKTFQTPPCIVAHQEDGKASLVLPGDAAWSGALQREQNRLEAEQMRLLYVALTRAKHQVHFWWGRVDSSRWNKSSTRSAFGQLLLPDPKDAEAYTDDECLAAFENAMKRQPDATHKTFLMGETAPWLIPAPAPENGAAAGSEESAPLQSAPWNRSKLSAAPLQSSYSSLTRGKPEAHRGDDEMEAVSPDEQEPLATSLPQPPVCKVNDVLEHFQGGKVLGVLIHSAFEVAMAERDLATAGIEFTKMLTPGLQGMVRKGVSTAPDADAALRE